MAILSSHIHHTIPSHTRHGISTVRTFPSAQWLEAQEPHRQGGDGGENGGRQ